MKQFNLNSIRVSKSSISIDPEPATNQTKSIGWDTIVNFTGMLLLVSVSHKYLGFAIDTAWGIRIYDFQNNKECII
jgi:hypothetical protein